jgi:hypothetical protein
VDEEEMTVLTNNFKGCDKRRLLDVFCVGMDVLWAVVRPIPPHALKTNKHDMKWATVMFYDTKQKAYKILLRSGAEEWCAPKRLDDELAVTQYSTLATKKAACMEAWNPNIQTVISKFGPFCVRNVGTRQRDQMTEITSAEPPPSLPRSSKPPVRVRTKAASAAMEPKGINEPGQTTTLNLADAATEERTPPLTEQASAEQPPSTPAEQPPIPSIPATTLSTLPTSGDTPVTVRKAESTGSDAAKKETFNLGLLKVKLQLAKAQSANASAKVDAAVSPPLVVPTTKKMSLTSRREAQAAKKVAELLPKASHASTIKVTITYPRTHKYTSQINLRLFL